jgi:hypothetical protein
MIKSVRFTDAAKAEGDRLMENIFYSMFDCTSDGTEGAFFTIDIPNNEVGLYLCERLKPGYIIANVARQADGRLKLELSAHDLVCTQTTIMLYFSHKAMALKGSAQVEFRMPGINWQPPSGKLEGAYTVREYMFANTYAKHFDDKRLKELREQSSVHE